MSKEALQEKIDKIRDAVEDESITNTQVAEILTELNEGKLEADLSSLTEEGKEKLLTLINSSMKTKVVLSGSNRTAVLVKNSNPEKTVLLKNVFWSGKLSNDSRYIQANIKYLGDDEYASVGLNNRNSGSRDIELGVLKGKDIIIECPDSFKWEEGEEVIVLVEFEII